MPSRTPRHPGLADLLKCGNAVALSITWVLMREPHARSSGPGALVYLPTGEAFGLDDFVEAPPCVGGRQPARDLASRLARVLPDEQHENARRLLEQP